MVIEAPLWKLLDLEIGFGILNLLPKIMTLFFFFFFLMFLHARHCSKPFACTNSFNSYNNPMRQVLLQSPFWWKAGGIEKLSIWPRVTQLVRDWLQLEPRLSCFGPSTVTTEVCCLWNIGPVSHIISPISLSAPTEQVLLPSFYT